MPGPMKRYAVRSSALSLGAVEMECRRAGARNIRLATGSKQVFCDLDDAGVQVLRTSGLTVTPLREYRTADQLERLYRSCQYAPPPVLVAGEDVYAGSLVVIMSGVWAGRNRYTPQLTGATETICIVDSGVRSTHITLKDKVVYEEDFSGSGNTDDEFDHGTGVAFMAAGGSPEANREQGVAPGSHLMNMKAVGGTGSGSAEAVAMAIDRAVELRMDGLAAGKSEDDPMVPNFLNVSLGSEDTGDPDEPVRVACRAAVETGMAVAAAAGNAGPNPGTIACPASDPYVLAVGALVTPTLYVWERSSRGPTKEGNVKPDTVFWGTQLLLPSAASDDAFVPKSGTSFASPAALALVALGDEAVQRTGAPGMPFLEALQLFEAAAGQMFLKPEGVPMGKDNDYGYGLLFGDMMLGALQAPTGMDAVLAGMTGVMAPMLMLGMMARMFRGM